MYKIGMSAGTLLMIGCVVVLATKIKKPTLNDVIAIVCMVAVIVIGVSEIV